MIAVVKRSFTSKGALVAQGSIVDTASWRNEASALRAGTIRPASASEVAAFAAREKTKGKK